MSVLELRTGLGYDSHRFAPGGPLILGGTRIPFDYSLVGHSDGDAVAHALIDAILGAACAGDIGELYPDTEDRWLGANSIELLRSAVLRVREDGWKVVHADVTVLTETPRIADYRPAMRAHLAEAMDVAPSAISIKGKTNERMGFVGRGEGLACLAVVTLGRTSER
jgi:2-C-methyl-D-erythritol 2,4-cyclodiphosphate synthase